MREVLQQIVRCGQGNGTLDAVEHLIQVGKVTSVHFANGLFTQANAENRFLSGIRTDDIQQESGFFRNAGSGREKNLVECFQFFQLELVVAFTVTSAPSSFSR